MRPGVLAVDLSLDLLCALASWQLIFHRKGLKSTAKAQRKETNYFFYFKIFCSSLRLGVLAVNIYFALLCALASWQLIFHRKGLKSTAKAQRRKDAKERN